MRMAGALRGLRYINFSVETKGEATDSSRGVGLKQNVDIFAIIFQYSDYCATDFRKKRNSLLVTWKKKNNKNGCLKS